MSNLATIEKIIPAMTDMAIDKVRQLESITTEAPQVDIPTSHTIHAGVYSRTITIPKGVLLTGALIKIATLLIISGDVVAFIGSETKRLTGYNVLPASAKRKQAFYAIEDANLTMLFKTNALSVEEAEREFTDETEVLLSRKESAKNNIVITGEK
jgi:hypothetical protein